MSDLSMDTKKVVKPTAESQEAGERVGKAVAEAMKSASSGLVMPGHKKDLATEKKITVPLGLDDSTSGDILKEFYSHNYEKEALKISKSIGAIINTLPNKQEVNKSDTIKNILESAKELSIFGGHKDIVPEPATTNKQDKNKALANQLTKSAINGLLSGVDSEIEKIIEDAKKHPGLNK